MSSSELYSFSLPCDEVHLWLIDLAQPEPTELRLQPLSPEERLKAASFRHERDRRRYVHAHLALHELLAAYSHHDPGSLELVAGTYGKPLLAAAHGLDWLRFNLSHSEDWAVIGLAHGRDLGVDIEYRRVLADAEAIATQVFTEREQELLQALSEKEYWLQFYDLWTRKEAYLKARGLGFALAPQSIDLSMQAEYPARVPLSDNDDARHWYHCNVALVEGFATAVVCEHSDWTLVIRHFKIPE